MATASVGLYIDDHPRKFYRPHPLLAYAANVVVNIFPGMCVLPIVAFCQVFPRMGERMYISDPWFPDMFGLERMRNAEMWPEIYESACGKKKNE